MKQRHLWFILAPVILVWFLALLVAESVDDGTLESDFLRTNIYPRLNSLSGSYTDIKFRARGSKPVQQKIVIIEIDDRAIKNVGRWPWHRDTVAMLTYAALEYGAKVVGLDIVFPEMDQRVPDEVAELLRANGLGDTIPTFETDLVLKRIIDLFKDKIVLGWMSDTTCRPAYDGELCDVMDPEQKQFLPLSFEKFAFDTITGQKAIDPAATQLASAPSVVSNRTIYNESAAYSGFLVNAAEDSNDIVRRAQLSILVDGTPHPSLPLVMAGIGLEKKLTIEFTDEGLIERIGFGDSHDSDVSVSPTGAMSINFRGAGYHFSYVGAWDIFSQEPEIPVQQAGVIRTEPVADIFKDAYVLIGVSAIGARDLRTFPFGNNIPGTEGLATILDNILTGDPIVRSSGIWGMGLLLVLMTLGAVGFGLAMIRLTALPAILASLVTIGAIALFDTYYIFGQRNIDLNTILLLGQLSSIFVVVVVTKYILEERRKKVIRTTFSKYLAPAVVDEMLKDPDNIKLGGEARELTIMMSDLRGFTATAERLSAEKVLEMLNHYLGTMADIIVDFEGTIDEFIGDAILVIFGAPFEKDDDARRAVACCLAMQKAMAAVNAHNTAHGLPTLEMGIALNTGEVTVGNIGSQRRLKYGVVCSHVNLTARIESNTVGGQLLISESTLKLAGEDIKIGEKYSIVAKGFPDPIVAYEILGIGGEYDIYVDEVDLALCAATPPVEVSYRIMTSKNDEGDEMTGTFSSVSALGAQLEGDLKLEALTNIKLRVCGEDGQWIDDDLYAKVVRGGESATLRFTAIPPAIVSEFGRFSEQSSQSSSEQS